MKYKPSAVNMHWIGMIERGYGKKGVPLSPGELQVTHVTADG